MTKIKPMIDFGVIMANICNLAKSIKCAAILFVSFFYCSLLGEPMWLDYARPYNSIMANEIRKAPRAVIDEKNINGYTGLMLAVKDGIVEETKDFLASRANAALTVNDSLYGNTAFHLAVIGADDAKTTSGNIEIIKLFIDVGVPLYVRNQRGSTPLHMVGFLINNKSEKMVITDILIENGAQVNAQDSFGNTMLHYAVQQNDTEWILEFRKKYNDFIDPNIKNNKGNTLYEEAHELGFDDDVDSVGASLTYPLPRLGSGPQGAVTRDSQNRTALMFALYRGNIDEAKQYITRGADVNAQDNNGFAPIHYAMLSARPIDALKCILEKNPNINSAERTFGNTPLLMIAQIEHAGDRQVALKMLMEKKADINAKNKKRQTLLDRINQQVKLGFKDHGLIKAIESYMKK